MRSPFKLLSAAFVVLAGALLFQACALQAEGERCDHENGNADCAPGLVCDHRESITGWVCCPAQHEAATTDVCRGASIPISDGGTDTGATTDSGTAGDTATDAGADTAKPDTATTETAADTGTATDTGSASDTAITDAASGG